MDKRDDARPLGETIGDLRLETGIVIASAAMSPADVERARRSGSLSMEAPDEGLARLEVGGVIVAEGKLRLHRGQGAFVVTKTYGDGEVRP